jgi:flagellar biogenesis protein FliO
MTNKKNLMIFTLILCSGLLGSVLTQHCFSDTPAPTEPNSLQTAESWFNTDLKTTTQEHIQQDLMKRFVYVILLVVLLGVAAYYLTKKLLPKLTVTQGKNISVVETVHLGPNKLLHLIQISDNRRLLIGSTSENINILADVTESLPAKSESNVNGN